MSLKLAVVLCLISTALNFLLTMLICKPYFPDTREVELDEHPCHDLYYVVVYNQMFTRLSPYICGMYVALNGDSKPNMALEIAAILVLLFIGQVGVLGDLNAYFIGPILNLIWTCTGR